MKRCLQRPEQITIDRSLARGTGANVSRRITTAARSIAVNTTRRAMPPPQRLPIRGHFPLCSTPLCSGCDAIRGRSLARGDPRFICRHSRVFFGDDPRVVDDVLDLEQVAAGLLRLDEAKIRITWRFLTELRPGRAASHSLLTLRRDRAE